MNTAFNQQNHLNSRCGGISQDSIYTVYVMWIQKKKKNQKTCKCTSVIPYVWLRMWFLNVTKRITPCIDWCELDGWNHIFMTQVIKFWIQLSNSSVQWGFPKKNRSEGEKHMDTTMSHMLPQWCIHMLHYTYCVYGILVLRRDSICGMRNVNLTKNGNHAWFYMSNCVCDKRMGHKILDSIIQFEWGRLSQEK